MKYIVQRFNSGPMGEIVTILNTETGGIIPLDEGNTDYRAYIAWVAEGNTAEEWTGE